MLSGRRVQRLPFTSACRRPYHGPVALSRDQLTELGSQFLSSMNARDYALAAALYADDATYQSASLSGDHVDGRITGRDRIMDYFKDSLEGDDKFQLSALDIFTGFNLTMILSSMEGRTFIDVLRIGDKGLIVEHIEASPKASPVDFLEARSKQ